MYDVTIRLPAWVSSFVQLGRRCEADDEKMRLVIELGRKNLTDADEPGGPFAAAIFHKSTGELLSVGVNAVRKHKNVLLHGETVAIMLGSKLVTDEALHFPMPAYEIVCLCEPCVMCLGAVYWAGLSRVLWAASRADTLELTGFDDGPDPEATYAFMREARGVTFEAGVLRDEARGVLRVYRPAGGTQS